MLRKKTFARFSGGLGTMRRPRSRKIRLTFSFLISFLCLFYSRSVYIKTRNVNIADKIGRKWIFENKFADSRAWQSLCEEHANRRKVSFTPLFSLSTIYKYNISFSNSGWDDIWNEKEKKNKVGNAILPHGSNVPIVKNEIWTQQVSTSRHLKNSHDESSSFWVFGLWNKRSKKFYSKLTLNHDYFNAILSHFQLGSYL